MSMAWAPFPRPQCPVRPGCVSDAQPSDSAGTRLTIGDWRLTSGYYSTDVPEDNGVAYFVYFFIGKYIRHSNNAFPLVSPERWEEMSRGMRAGFPELWEARRVGGRLNCTKCALCQRLSCKLINSSHALFKLLD